MVTTITLNEFISAFKGHYAGRYRFSDDGLVALFGYLEEYGESCDNPTELDIVAICSEFTEYNSAAEAAENYGQENLREHEAFNFLEENTIVIDFGERVIIADF